MVTPQVRFNFDSKLLNLSDRYASQVRSVTNSWAGKTRDRLVGQSYTGATLRLKNSWAIIPAQRRRNTLDLRVVIINREPTSLYRVAGRGPGKFVPIAPLTDWVLAKGIESNEKRARGIAFAISKAIASRGTQRFRDKQNFLGLNFDGTLQKDSVIFGYADELADLVNAIKI